MSSSGRLDPLSALLGACAISVPFALPNFQTQHVIVPRHAPLPVTVEELPHPREFIRIDPQAGSYVVPAGKVLVMTAAGAPSSSTAAIDIWINGIREYNSVTGQLEDFPRPGLKASAGDLVEFFVVASAGARIWGYLVDA